MSAMKTTGLSLVIGCILLAGCKRAKSVAAPKYNEHPALQCGYYSYWDGVPLKGGEIYARDRRFMGLWPTNENKTLLFVAWPVAEFDTFRADVEGSYMATIDLVPGVAERVRQGKRVERIVGSADMPNFYRKPYGPGWALVGDAGYTKDPVSAYGISDAFRDAELLAEAIDAGFADRRPLELAMSDYEQKRNTASKPLYDMTIENASMKPRPAFQIEFMRALKHNPTAASQFFGVLTGLINPNDFFTPQNIFQILKVRGLAKIVLGQIFPTPQRRAS